MCKVIHYVEDVLEFLMYQSQKRRLMDRELRILRGLNEWMENDDNYVD
jgi:hypothetical protein